MSMSTVVDPTAPTWAQDIIQARKEKVQADVERLNAMVEEAKAHPTERALPLPPGSVKISYSTPEEVKAQHAALAAELKYARPGSAFEAAMERWAATREAQSSPEVRRAAAEAYWRDFAQKAGVTPPENVLEGIDIWT